MDGYGVVTVNKPSTNVIVLGKDASGRITVSFHYDPQLVEKVKTIEGRKWHKDQKYWSFPNTDRTLEKILPRTTALPNTKLIPGLHLWLSVVRGLNVFEGEEIHIDPELYTSARVDSALHAKNIPSPLVGEGKSLPRTCFGGEGLFEDLRRELVSRKYSYRTVKGYVYYNRDLLNFIGKTPYEITDDDIKDYLLYLIEEKQSATSTLNQAINPALSNRALSAMVSTGYSESAGSTP